MEIHLGLLGIKEFHPKNITPKFTNLKLDKKYYSCVEIEIKFRTVPRATQSQQGVVYIHSGKTELNIKAYAFTDKQLEELKNLQKQEDLELIQGMVDVSLKEIQEEVERYLKNDDLEEKNKKPEKVKFESPFKGLYDGFKQALIPFKNLKHAFGFRITADSSYYEKIVKDAAKEQAEAFCYVIYDVYKKSHGMLAW